MKLKCIFSNLKTQVFHPTPFSFCISKLPAGHVLLDFVVLLIVAILETASLHMQGIRLRTMTPHPPPPSTFAY